MMKNDRRAFAGFSSCTQLLTFFIGMSLTVDSAHGYLDLIALKSIRIATIEHANKRPYERRA